MRNKKSIWIWFGEAALIFVSVLGAFWIEDYRHNRQEYQDYLSVLVNFRNDVNADIIEFRFQVDSTIKGGGTYIYLDRTLEEAEGIMVDDIKQNDYEVFKVLSEGNWYTGNWRTKSEYFDILADYSTYLMQDTLVSTLRLYEWVMNTESNMQDQWTTEVTKYLNFIESNVDFEELANTNPKVTSSLFLKNWILNTKDFNKSRMMGDQVNVNRLINILNTLDERLKYHDIDPKTLNPPLEVPTYWK